MKKFLIAAGIVLATTQTMAERLKVYIMAGQLNMEGHAH